MFISLDEGVRISPDALEGKLMSKSDRTRVRTWDLFRVKELRYHCATQSDRNGGLRARLDGARQTLARHPMTSDALNTLNGFQSLVSPFPLLMGISIESWLSK